jgi:hypothetical protein
MPSHHSRAPSEDPFANVMASVLARRECEHRSTLTLVIAQLAREAKPLLGPVCSLELSALVPFSH